MSLVERMTGRAGAGGDPVGAQDETDPRELEPWFEVLDPAVQALLRERWAEQRAEWDRVLRNGRRSYLESAGQGALHFVLVHTLMLVMFAALGVSFVGLQLLVVGAVGAALGLLWERVHAREMICVFSTMGVLALLELALVSAGGISWPAALVAPWLGAWLAQYVGTMRGVVPGS